MHYGKNKKQNKEERWMGTKKNKKEKRERNGTPSLALSQ
jgi:hypothetical protein